MNITDVQVFQAGTAFSVNFAIDGSWMIQLGTDGRFSIPKAAEAAWSDDLDQDRAARQYDAKEIAELLDLPVELDRIDETFTPEYF